MEPLALGFSSGIVCVASCGPVLLPWLASERAALRATLALLATFLLGRLLGYLGFGVVSWVLGLAVPSGRTGSILFACAHLGLAAALLAWSLATRRRCDAACDTALAARRSRKLRGLAPLAFGFLTGLSPCAPFLAAGVRASQLQSLPGALAYFALFFVGTSIWFAPFTAVSALRRFGALSAVARLTTAVVAAWYGYLGVIALSGAIAHG
jgi:sulfite exporter TauE/SafE